MIDQLENEEPRTEAKLSHAAAKLLLHLLRLGDGKWPVTHLQRGAGIRDWRTFAHARDELYRFGYWDDATGKVLFPVAVTGVAPVTITPVAPVVPVTSTYVAPVTTTDRGFLRALPLEAEVHPDPATTVIPINWRERAMQSDLLPGGGAEHQRTSEFQARRRVQVEVLQGAWRELFKQPLTTDTAKDLLSLTDNFAEDVLDVMETTKARGVQSPRGYIVKMLQNKRAQQPTVRSANIGSPSRGEDEAGSDDNYYLTKPTEKTAKLTAKLAKLGLLKDEDDDE